MKSIKKLMGIMLWALVAILGTPQVFAGTVDMMGKASLGPTETPGVMAVFLDYLALMF
jgi:hypothetical protein